MKQKLILVVILVLLCFLWLRGGFDTIFLDTDLARDLHEMSNIKLHKVVWLGPRLSAGFPSSPLYYYLYYPVLHLSGFNANSLIVQNVVVGFAALAILGLFCLKKWGTKAYFIVGTFGLMPFWTAVAIHPGNGYTYIFWLMIALVLLWFEAPFMWPSLFLGLAIAYHPAAIFGLLFLFYEWWRRGHRLVNALIIVIFLIGPWAPIIAFEIITKGYLMRSWYIESFHSYKTQLQFSFENIRQIISTIGAGILITPLIWLYSAVTSQNRNRIWLLLSVPVLLFFVVAPSFPPHYMLGITCIVVFIMVVSLAESKHGGLILPLLCIYLVGRTVLAKPPSQTRSIPKIETVVNKFVKKEKLNKRDKIALISIVNRNAKVPQADDYRFFFRVKGYEAVEVTDYSQANKMVMFVETNKFDWKKWSSWETEQFGSRKIEFTTSIDGIDVIGFTK